MATNTYKGKLKQKTADGVNILHPETEANAVLYSSDATGFTSVANVKDALDTIITAGVGVTDVQNGSGTSLVEDSIATVTPDNIGAVAKNNNNLSGATKCKITYDSKGLVTKGENLAVDDLPNSIPTSKINGLGEAASKGVATSVTKNGTDLVTAGAVWTAIDELPEPMVFKGTLGTNGSITTLPTPATGATGNEGHTYKVITAGTYASQAAKVGDVFTSTGSAWVLIPSGDVDTDTDTWRGIKVNGTPKLGNGINSGDVDFVDGGNVTVSFNSTGNKITLGVAANHSIPSTDDQAAWSAKQDALATQTAYSAKGTTTKVPQITTNTLGQVTKIEEKSIAFPDITIGSATGGGNAITAIAVDSANKHKINVTTGTFLTAYDISGKANLVGSNLFTGGTQNINVDGVNTTTPSAGAGVHVSCTEDSTYYHAKVTPSGYEVYTGAGTTSDNQPYAKYGIGNIKYESGDGVMHLLTLPAKTGTIVVNTDIANFATKSSMTAGTYSAVAVNSQGIVTSGGQVFEVVNNGVTPSVVTGGLYFEKDAEQSA